MNLRILTYNIHGAQGTDGKRDFQRIGQFLKSQNIDIALIQELDTRFEDRSTEEDIEALKCGHFIHVAAAPTVECKFGWYGNAILSRYPIVKSSIIDISGKAREPRNILETFIQTPKGLLHVVNTHKGLRASDRRVQFEILHKLLDINSDIPLVVGGDLNEWFTRAESIKKMDALLRPICPAPTFPSVHPLLKLDRMWCRPHNLVTSSKVMKSKETRYYSDHLPLLAEITI